MNMRTAKRAHKKIGDGIYNKCARIVLHDSGIDYSNKGGNLVNFCYKFGKEEEEAKSLLKEMFPNNFIPLENSEWEYKCQAADLALAFLLSEQSSNVHPIVIFNIWEKMFPRLSSKKSREVMDIIIGIKLSVESIIKRRNRLEKINKEWSQENDDLLFFSDDEY